MATLHHFLAQLQQHHQQSLPLLPSRAKTRHFLNNFMAFLFPNWHEHPATAQQLEAQWNDLQSQLHDLLRPLQPTLQQPIATLIDQYFEQIPSVYDQLLGDAQYFLAFDPAAYSIEEVMFGLSGFLCHHGLSVGASVGTTSCTALAAPLV